MSHTSAAQPDQFAADTASTEQLGTHVPPQWHDQDATHRSPHQIEQDDAYPEQHHAGQVGYGPNHNQGVGFSEKLTGLKEEIKGKITKNHDLVEQGHERRNGEPPAEQ